MKNIKVFIFDSLNSEEIIIYFSGTEITSTKNS